MHKSEPSTPLTEAAHSLLGMVDELAERAHLESQRKEAAYRELVDPAEHLQACRRTMVLVLNELALVQSADLAETLTYIGHRRARQGVGMDAMLHSFRIDFQIAGEALFDWLATRPPDIATQWTDFVLPLWRAIDKISVVVSEAYRNAEAEMAGELERDARALFHELLHGSGPASAVVRRAASRLGLGERGQYVVVRADQDVPNQTVQSALARLGLRSVWLHDANLLTGIVVLGPGGYRQLRDCLTDTLRTRVGASPIYHALEDTRHLVWLADAARDATPPDRHAVVMAADDVPSVFVGGAPEVTRHLADTLATALRAARPAERNRLLETVHAHLAGDGSPTSTAQRLYRHRNTVLNHLRRFEELTGLDLSRPSDVATAVLSLRALHRLTPEAPPTPE
ncbi:PucR family transcriptional regulator [Pseudonocardia spinosispora]|uniref:PucR family transcriptional regulator n=1 Tax=Pseudonocardia spinosispora TaxID=103441 RepID=UPI0004155034|nr:helix-turn-helix domain-containing protein [Pseudonocardia spinosispora]